MQLKKIFSGAESFRTEKSLQKMQSGNFLYVVRLGGIGCIGYALAVGQSSVSMMERRKSGRAGYDPLWRVGGGEAWKPTV
jgi:hypothetical protein